MTDMLYCKSRLNIEAHTLYLYDILYNNAVRTSICEGWHFAHMLKALE